MNILSVKDIKMSTNYDTIKVKGDGNCFYRALSLFLHNNEEDYKLIRMNVLSFLSDKKNHYQTTLGLSHIDWNKLIENAGKDGGWAGDPEISAASEWINLTIKVRQTNGKWISFGTGSRTVFLEHVNQNHFDLLMPSTKKETSELNNLTNINSSSMLFFIMLFLNILISILHFSGNNVAVFMTASGFVWYTYLTNVTNVTKVTKDTKDVKQMLKND